jgi:hypothetical protein
MTVTNFKTRFLGETMKSYSGKGIFNAKDARSRRGPKARFCRGYYQVEGPDGRIFGQLDNDRLSIVESALANNASCYFWFNGSMEEWMDGYPFEKVEL